MKSAPRTTPITSLPRPLPIAAPAIRPGISRIWIFAPLCSSAPGTTVSVVNAYAPTSEFVPVSLFRSVDFPVDGKPTRTTVASPDFLTVNPSPPPADFMARLTASSRIFAIFALIRPMCFEVALL